MQKLLDKLGFSKKGQELIKMYGQMVKGGYDRSDNVRVDDVFSDFELRAYRSQVRNILREHSIKTVLDYGCGGSDWHATGFDGETGLSARAYFNLDKVCMYEPARDMDERERVECVISFDVMEHIFIADVPRVLRDMFSLASKLLVLNIACYPAAAQLPNGENAHVTVRQPVWWKGMVDSIAVEFPDVIICLICSSRWRKSSAFPEWSAGRWFESSTFVVNN